MLSVQVDCRAVYTESCWAFKSSDVLLLRGRFLTKLKYYDVRQLRIIDGFEKNVIKFCKILIYLNHFIKFSSLQVGGRFFDV
jgi:hypothetical protein